MNKINFTKGENKMTIGEVINMLMKIFEYLAEILGGMFNQEEGEAAPEEEIA